MVGAAIADYNGQKEVAQKEAEKSAKALEMMGEATVPYLQNIDTITEQAKTDIANAKAMWTQTVEKADEYVQQGVNSQCSESHSSCQIKVGIIFLPKDPEDQHDEECCY